MTIPEITIIDYGMGNLLSVQRGLEYLGAKTNVTSDPEIVLNATKIVLPGVGAFAMGMGALTDLGLADAIKEKSKCGTPLLGICLGMQLFFEESEEFELTSGLGLIPGRVIPVPARELTGVAHKIPHIGWSPIEPANIDEVWKDTLLQDNVPGEAFYFVHSFMVAPKNPANTIAYCSYGGHRIPAVINSKHITGCQFHPEKSGEDGLKILHRFISQ